MTPDEQLSADLKNHSMADTNTLDKGADRIAEMSTEIDALTEAVIALTGAKK